MDASLAGLLVPAWRFTELGTILKITEGRLGEYAALLETLHLFSQRDWIVVCPVTVASVHLFLSRRDGLKVEKSTSPHDVQELVYLVVSTAVLSPEVQVHSRLQPETLGSDATSTPSPSLLPDT
ncbi:hypothetical protein FPRO05_10475 [Fusarium proliferatum]|uniref:Uncharacterized protein n=1 Tax=Gibberella intermedia TaxID=948311 RepID=A0A365NDF7_GIBIN|nr:hypothetical protein FPRO05_10475 [Fusarium proliferatum]